MYTHTHNFPVCPMKRPENNGQPSSNKHLEIQFSTKSNQGFLDT